MGQEKSRDDVWRLTALIRLAKEYGVSEEWLLYGHFTIAGIGDGGIFNCKEDANIIKIYRQLPESTKQQMLKHLKGERAGGTIHL
ncbi:hypothetical protein FACS189492_1750 [Clostridia bacterium]|nr:hypothetical protein FACS189492_1750 [Clostridia bacterium]